MSACPHCNGSGLGNPLPPSRYGPRPCITCRGTGKSSPQADPRHPSAADCCATPSPQPAPHSSRPGQPGGAGQTSSESA